MTGTATSPREHAAKREPDPFAEAVQRLFAPLQNRILAQAAGALAKNRLGAADSLVTKFLEKKPADADALNLKAEIACLAGRLEEGAQLFRRCTQLSPGRESFRYRYAVVLGRLQKNEEAIAQLNRLLTENPRNVLYRDEMITILTGMGRHSEALVYCRGLFEEFPDLPHVLLRYGDALRNAGFQAECIAVYRKLLDAEPGSGTAYSKLASLKIYHFTAADIEAMEKLLGSAQLSANARAELHHALGRAYGDLKRYDRSFESYARGNALRRIQVGFDRERLVAHRQACEAFFTEAFFCQRTGWGDDSRAPVFIVGIPRSGSTLLEQILASHSAIEGVGEFGNLDTALVQPLSAFREEVQLQRFADSTGVNKHSVVNAYVQIFDRLDRDQFRSMAQSYLALTDSRRATQRPFFTDKTLRNFFYVGLIHLILPKSKIIDVRRNPLDCGWSCFTSELPGGYFALRLSDVGEDYANYVRLMAHFDRVLPGRIHRVIYERLVADPETELRRLFAYLELPFEEGCLRFYENKRPVYTQSSEQVRKPIYQSGVGQWKPYEPWLGPLKSILGPILDCYPDVPA